MEYRWRSVISSIDINNKTRHSQVLHLRCLYLFLRAFKEAVRFSTLKCSIVRIVIIVYLKRVSSIVRWIGSIRLLKQLICSEITAFYSEIEIISMDRMVASARLSNRTILIPHFYKQNIKPYELVCNLTIRFFIYSALKNVVMNKRPVHFCYILQQIFSRGGYRIREFIDLLPILDSITFPYLTYQELKILIKSPMMAWASHPNEVNRIISLGRSFGILYYKIIKDGITHQQTIQVLPHFGSRCLRQTHQDWITFQLRAIRIVAPVIATSNKAYHQSTQE